MGLVAASWGKRGGVHIQYMGSNFGGRGLLVELGG